MAKSYEVISEKLSPLQVVREYVALGVILTLMCVTMGPFKVYRSLYKKERA